MSKEELDGVRQMMSEDDLWSLHTSTHTSAQAYTQIHTNTYTHTHKHTHMGGGQLVE